jgi:hypothetical protein
MTGGRRKNRKHRRGKTAVSVRCFCRKPRFSVRLIVTTLAKLSKMAVICIDIYSVYGHLSMQMSSGVMIWAQAQVLGAQNFETAS